MMENSTPRPGDDQDVAALLTMIDELRRLRHRRASPSQGTGYQSTYKHLSLAMSALDKAIGLLRAES